MPRHFFLPTTTIVDATHPPRPSSARHNATMRLTVTRSCPAQVRKYSTLPFSLLTPPGATSLAAMWHQTTNDDIGHRSSYLFISSAQQQEATPLTCTTWSLDRTTTATPHTIRPPRTAMRTRHHHTPMDSYHTPPTPHHHTLPTLHHHHTPPTHHCTPPMARPNECDRPR